MLNYKKIEYQTKWIEFPDVAPTFKSFGIPPHPPDHYIEYSCPAIQLPNTEYVMDSRAIATAIEKHFPEPSLHLNTKETDEIHFAIDQVMRAIAPPYVYRIPDWLLSPRGSTYYTAKRQELFGMDLYAVADHPEFSVEKIWRNAEAPSEKIKEILHRNPEGPYVLGQEVSYSDMVLAGWWRLLKMLDQEGDLHGRMMGFDGAFGVHEDACRGFMERDDH